MHRVLLQENYGKPDHEAVAKVKEVYRELHLAAVFEAYEQSSFEELTAAIAAQAALPKEVFTALLDKIYKRKK
jgi:farnesyl diphosphate synthase